MDRRLVLGVVVLFACLMVAPVPRGSAQTCAECGDSVIDACEVCDPPGGTNGCGPGATCDGCCQMCAVTCGDGVLGGTEACDPPGGPCGVGEICLPNCTCTTAYCGNGTVDGGELCDPPGSQSTCAANEVCRGCDECTTCGNGTLDSGETCDPSDPGSCSAGTCRSDCTGCRSKCSALELKLAVEKARYKVYCYAKAVGKGVPVLQACLDKAELKFNSKFPIVATLPDCLSTVDAATIEAKVDAFVADLMDEIAPAP